MVFLLCELPSKSNDYFFLPSCPNYICILTSSPPPLLNPLLSITISSVLFRVPLCVAIVQQLSSNILFNPIIHFFLGACQESPLRRSRSCPMVPTRQRDRIPKPMFKRKGRWEWNKSLDPVFSQPKSLIALFSRTKERYSAVHLLCDALALPDEI